MADEQKALVERLREPADWAIERPLTELRDQAADTIEAQAREIERLRDALGEICRDSNPDWMEKRVYPNDVLDDIHTIAVKAYYEVKL